MMDERVSEKEVAPEREEVALLVARQTPVVTYGLIAINLLVYVAMVVKGISPMSPTVQQILPWGADFGPLTMNGQWWRLLSACFLHFGLIHVGMNMFILYQVGPLTEVLFGRGRYLLAYLLAGIGGNIAGLYVHPLTVGAGASGAVFGVYGALLGFLLIERGVVPAERAVQIAKSAGLFIAYNLVFGLASAKTDLTAHVAGLAVGFAAGCLLARPIYPLGELHLLRTAGVAMGGLLLGIGCFRALPRRSVAQDDWYRQIMFGRSIDVGANDRVFYGGTATKADAEGLAKGLEQVGLFRRPGMVVLLSKGAGGTSISLAVGKEDGPAKSAAWNDPAFLGFVEQTGALVAPSVGGAPLRMLLLNQKGELKKEIKVDTNLLVVGTSDRVFYSGAASEENATALGMSLRSAGYFRDKGGAVLLSKADGRTDVSFVVADGAWDNPAALSAVQAVARQIAASVGGVPFNVHLVDRGLRDRKDIAVR